VAGFAEQACLRFPRQAQFHPLRYLKALAQAITRNGGRIFTNTRVNEIKGGTDASVATENGQRIAARFIVVATNTPINNMVVMHTKQAAYRSYAIALDLPASALFNGLIWDTEDPFHYVRWHPRSGRANGQAGGLLIVGGEDHKTGQGNGGEGERFARLESWARDRFPAAGATRQRWSGQIMESNDGIGFIGRNPSDEDNVFIATGDSGVGMTHGTIAGMLISDLILGRPNSWAEVYDPARKRGAWEFTKENVNVALQYFDWLSGGDVDSTDRIAAGSGAVVRRGLSKIACYRDADGKLHEISASCPHLGCVVAWNAAESSWDCPCHGSRFDAKGKVLNGPAIADLSPAPGTTAG
jgi:nitrite reductase/ring-hydroxylating ferredoxin subunit